MHIMMEAELRNGSAPRHKDVHWLYHRCYIDEHKRVCCVTSEPTQSSSRRVSSYKDSSALLKTEW